MCYFYNSPAQLHSPLGILTTTTPLVWRCYNMFGTCWCWECCSAVPQLARCFSSSSNSPLSSRIFYLIAVVSFVPAILKLHFVCCCEIYHLDLLYHSIIFQLCLVINKNTFLKQNRESKESLVIDLFYLNDYQCTKNWNARMWFDIKVKIMI